MKFQRIDSALDPSMIDESREKTLLDAEGKTQSARIADFFRANLQESNLTIEAKSLANDALPGVVLIDENMRRLRDYQLLTQGKTASIPFKKTFVINTNHKLVQAVCRLTNTHPQIAHDLSRQIYDLSRLVQKEAPPEELEPILARNQQLLEQLTSLVP